MGKETKAESAGIAAIIVVIVLLFVAVTMAWGALAIACANSWILKANFSDGWSAAWSHPWILLGWSLLFVAFSKISTNYNS